MGCCSSQPEEEPAGSQTDRKDDAHPTDQDPENSLSDNLQGDDGLYISSHRQSRSASPLSSRPSILQLRRISGVNDVSDQISDFPNQWTQSTSTAYLYTGSLESSMVAIKVLRLPTSILESYEQNLQTWAKLDHENIVNLLGYYIGNQVLELHCQLPAMVYPWYTHGNIRQYIAEKYEVITNEERMQLVKDVAKGLEYLHTHAPPVVHGNLKPENILVDEDGFARLVDFGISNLEAECPRPPEMTHSEPTTASSRPFWAPERKARGFTHTSQADIFSLGCVALEVALGIAPYAKQDEHIIVIQQKKGKKPSERPMHELTETEEQLWGLLEECWDMPLNRPSAGSFLRRLTAIRS